MSVDPNEQLGLETITVKGVDAFFKKGKLLIYSAVSLVVVHAVYHLKIVAN